MKNYVDKNGANELARRIQEYWSSRGYQVEIDLRPVEFTTELRSSRYDVRSNLVNGWPTRKLPQGQAA
ncbi:MAG: phosphoglycolate phosphatase [Pseudomonadota bacterium]